MNNSSKGIDSRSQLVIALVASSLTALTACRGDGGGGGGGSAASGNTGQIVDSLVEGLHYSSGSFSGLTDANGHFEYEAGGEVTFSIGDIVLGTVDGSSVLTIVDFGNPDGMDGPYFDDRINNIARFLQTIDDDDDPSTGILISAGTRELAAGMAVDDWDDWEQVEAALKDLTPNEPVSFFGAAQHGHAWLVASKVGMYEGTWEATAGEYAGYSGTLHATIGNNGDIAIVCTFEEDGAFGDFGGFSASGMGGPEGEEDGRFGVDVGFGYFVGTVVGETLSGTLEPYEEEGVSANEGVFSAELSHRTMAFLDMDYLGEFTFLDKQNIKGLVSDEHGVPKYDFGMNFSDDEFGRYRVSLAVIFSDGEAADECSFQVTSMNETEIGFSGLCERGEGFEGVLTVDGENASVSGTYYNMVDDGWAGGTFSGELISD